MEMNKMGWTLLGLVIGFILGVLWQWDNGQRRKW
jgi:hypothetical protein